MQLKLEESKGRFSYILNKIKSRRDEVEKSKEWIIFEREDQN